MPQRPDANPPTGKPLDEGQLLDWIDGRLSEQDQARLEASSGRPGLRQRVAQMQANTRTLRALSVERAPLDLKDRVLAALERDSLVADAEREHPPESLPISLADNISVRRGGRLSRLVPTFALAAGLVLLVGGGMYWASLLFRHSVPTTRSGGPMAGRTESPKPEAAPVHPSPAAASDMAVAAAPTEAVPETALASIETVGPPAPLRMDQAVALAEAGRLAIRVIGADAAKVRQIENARRDQDWRLARTTSPEVALALLPLTARPEHDGEPVLASSPELAARHIALMADAREAFSPPPSVSHVHGAFVLDAAASQTSIEAFVSAVAQRLGAEIELAELHTPVHAEPTPEGALWWTQSPSQWTPRVHVPVIIESR